MLYKVNWNRRYLTIANDFARPVIVLWNHIPLRNRSKCHAVVDKPPDMHMVALEMMSHISHTQHFPDKLNFLWYHIASLLIGRQFLRLVGHRTSINVTMTLVGKVISGVSLHNVSYIQNVGSNTVFSFFICQKIMVPYALCRLCLDSENWIVARKVVV